MKKILITSLFILGITDIAVSQDQQPIQPVLRVAVINNSPSVNLSIKGPYEIKTLQTEELIESGSFLKSTDVFPVPEGIEIGKKPYKFFGIKIEPGKDAFILINDRIYRGEIDIIRTKDTKLLLVNHVGLEDYLYGVLYHEVSPRWPIEALKAQAIVSRTYALYQKSINETKDFDLTSDFYSQVYGGKTSEKYRTTRAVDLTRGEVLIYEGKLLPAYFHATCGGRTEDASELWNTDLAPLKGIKCNFCRLSPHYRWENSLSFEEMMEKFAFGGYGDFSRIIAVVPKDKNPSGRLKTLNIITDSGQISISAKDFRQIMDPRIIRSTNFDVTVEGNKVTFKGYGWGHGVGLCQWGAYFMALRGYKVKEIFKLYYPGTEIK